MVHPTVEGPASSQPSSRLDDEESTRFIELPRSAEAGADRDLLGMLAPAELTLRMSPAAKRGVVARPALPSHEAGELTRIGVPRPPTMPATLAAWPAPEACGAPPESLPATPRLAAFVALPLAPSGPLAEPTPVTVRDPLAHARAQDAHYGRWAAGFLLTLGALFVVSLFVPHGARRTATTSGAVAAAPPSASEARASGATGEAAMPSPAAPAFTVPSAVVVTADFAAPLPSTRLAPPERRERLAAPLPTAKRRSPAAPNRRVADARAPKSVPMTPAEIEQFKRDPHGYMKHLEP